jgi:NADPH:quinone reductase
VDVKDFYPIDYLPKGVRLSAYGGEADDLPAPVLQRFLCRIADGRIDLGPATTYRLEKIPKAHTDIDANRVAGKLVGLTAEVSENTAG